MNTKARAGTGMEQSMGPDLRTEMGWVNSNSFPQGLPISLHREAVEQHNRARMLPPAKPGAADLQEKSEPHLPDPDPCLGEKIKDLLSLGKDK